MNTLLTIGYEGSTIEDFVSTLKLSEVQILIDVRDVPVSRKRGFSKKALSENLEDAGVKYVHLRELGNPKLGREAAKRGDTQSFERIFREHLACEKSQTALDSAIGIASRARACLLCFERDPLVCHRKIVADEIGNREDFEVRHIGVQHGLARKESYADIEDAPAYAFG